MISCNADGISRLTVAWDVRNEERFELSAADQSCLDDVLVSHYDESSWTGAQPCHASFIRTLYMRPEQRVPDRAVTVRVRAYANTAGGELTDCKLEVKWGGGDRATEKQSQSFGDPEQALVLLKAGRVGQAFARAECDLSGPWRVWFESRYARRYFFAKDAGGARVTIDTKLCWRELQTGTVVSWEGAIVEVKYHTMSNAVRTTLRALEASACPAMSKKRKALQALGHVLDD